MEENREYVVVGQEEKIESNNPYNQGSTTQSDVETGPWKVFARVGRILGIISLATCWFMPICQVVAAPGIVFSILGKRSNMNRELASTGLKFSIIGAAVSFVSYILLIIIMALFS